MQVQSFKLRGCEPVAGIVLRQGSARVLVQSSPRDYELDGYLLLRNHQLTFSSGERERQLALVLQLKGWAPVAVPPYSVESDRELFTHLRETQELVGLYIQNDTFLAGRVHQVNGASFRLHLLSTEGRWLKIHPFRFERIKIIETGTHYLHSLHLLATHNNCLPTP